MIGIGGTRFFKTHPDGKLTKVESGYITNRKQAETGVLKSRGDTMRPTCCLVNSKEEMVIRAAAI